MALYAYALDTTEEGVVAVATSQEDAPESKRFEVKANMAYWVQVDYSRPELATRLVVAGDLIDTDDQATIDILTLAPEITYVGLTPV